MAVVTTNALQRLIQSGLDAKGWTLADLSRETRRLDADHKGVAYSSLAAWMNPRGRSTPRPWNLDLVARALGVDGAAVHKAAREAGGYRVDEAVDTDDPDLQVFAADYRQMSPEARARLMRIVRNVMNDEDLFPKRNGNGGRG